MAGFRVQRLVSRDPRGTVGFRTIAAGPHRVRLALLRGGGSKAVALLHPIGEGARRNPEPFGWAYNERTGYYDITLNGKAAGPRMLRFGELRKAMAYARKQNERAAMAERAATWPTRAASHVQARLFNPAPRRRR